MENDVQWYYGYILTKLASKKEKEYIQLEDKHSPLVNKPLDVVLTKGHGVWVYDIKGKKYLDLLAGFSALNQGHRHPEIVKSLKRQADRLTLTTRTFRNSQLPLLLKDIHKIFGYKNIIVTNTGGEAVDTAVKIAKNWAEKNRNIPLDKVKIITFQNGYHASNKVDKGKKDSIVLPYGDIEAVEKTLKKEPVGAIMVEPIQGSTVEVPPKGFLSKLHKLAKKHKVLFIADEIQTGLGRTGKLLAIHHEGIKKPDMILLGKSLSGGVYPVSAVLTKKNVTMKGYGSTFGGNPLGSATARTALKVLIKEKLPERAQKLGDYFMEKLREIAKDSPYIKNIDGKGLLIGIKLTDKAYSVDIQKKLAKEGVLVGRGYQMLRISPPLIIKKQEIDHALDKFKKVLAK